MFGYIFLAANLNKKTDSEKNARKSFGGRRQFSVVPPTYLSIFNCKKVHSHQIILHSQMEGAELDMILLLHYYIFDFDCEGFVFRVLSSYAKQFFCLSSSFA